MGSSGCSGSPAWAILTESVSKLLTGVVGESSGAGDVAAELEFACRCGASPFRTAVMGVTGAVTA
jgi:hypothetical protein